MYRQPYAFYLSLLILAGVATAAVAAAEEKPQFSAILDHMEQAQRQSNSRAYTVTREYRFYGSTEDTPKSEVTASISFIPPREKTFVIEQSEGAKRGEKIVERVLESEAEAARQSSAALNRSHYDFALSGEDVLNGHRCWVLRMKPKHPEKDLFDGRAWLDQDSYMIRRIDGDMSKLPSWWLKNVHVTVNFDAAAGVWVQTETRAVADVRIFGKHILTGDAINVRTAEATANLLPSMDAASPVQQSTQAGNSAQGNTTRPRSSTAPMVGADVFMTK